jgi:predicted lipoprotein with Yx(FWY)xxD motif
MRRRVLAVVALLGLAVALAACGDDSSDDAGDNGSDDTTTTEAAPDTSAAATGPATVALGDTELGEVLVDAEGKTLYLYTPDEQGATTTASAELQQAWPPLTVESADEVVAGEGVDEALLGTAEQADGTIWVTYNDHLLYRFTGDAAAGDTAGQALGDVWFAVTPAGEQAA